MGTTQQLVEHPAYIAAAELHAQVIDLSARVEGLRAFFRNARRLNAGLKVKRTHPEFGADADRAVCGLVSKAATTFQAVKLLTDANHGDDAAVLCRTLLENVIVLEWLLVDPMFRLDVYCLSPELMKRRYAEVLKIHYTHDPRLIAAADFFLSSESAQDIQNVFGSTHYRWARRLVNGKVEAISGLKDMAEELASQANPSTPSASFMFDAVYFRLSGVVHSTADAIGPFVNDLKSQRHFKVQVSLHHHRSLEVLRASNFFMLSAISGLDQYAGLGLEQDIDSLADRMKQSV